MAKHQLSADFWITVADEDSDDYEEEMDQDYQRTFCDVPVICIESDTDNEEEIQSDEQDGKSDSDEEREPDRNPKIICEHNQMRETVGIRMALLNVRSLNEKKDTIRRLIKHNKLDVFLSTETWLHWYKGERVLADASPQDFRFYHEARLDRGGGVAIQYSEVLQGRQIFFRFITAFEYVAVELQHDEWDAPILLINIYRPPGSSHVFLDEFEKLLREMLRASDSIILTGDFNIHVDKALRSTVSKFNFHLRNNGLAQHVDAPTHENGHTLDLVITRNVDISNLSVKDDEISDHYTVYFNAVPVSKKR